MGVSKSFIGSSISPTRKRHPKSKLSKSNDDSLAVGDQVVYPHHGVATVQKIERKEVLGEKKKYLVLKLDQGDLTLMVPADAVEEVGIRDLIGQTEVRKVLKVLGLGKVTDHADNWSRRYKANQELLRSGDVKSVAEVVRNLSIRDRNKGLSTGEKRMYNRAREILMGELAVAMSVDIEKAEVVLEEALGAV